MKFLRNIAFRPILGMVGFILLAGCSAIPIKMQCSEIQARMNYQDMSEDQMRFAKDELDECLIRQNQAEARDSGFIEGAEKRFTPETNSRPDSTLRDSIPTKSTTIP